ncbi:hypothetical protein DVA67_018260 [Solirubrobacter sp. CPCC 204708]|uniref:Uncharacterized protein n=1 Tax=Solirubrobacter deserti TaxID=2282478 RepID=A0ABT4RVJ1_9ACTN|nr:hypothetical protein [Solirubrobacter deserti]MBE2317931.1 hypothetical protein [Solirubrobacter deserti]MDA0142281.1 hypothetical protein [Solirubrobacter deserti]
MIARLAVAATLLGSAVGATAVLAADEDPRPRTRPPAVDAAAAASTPEQVKPDPLPVERLRLVARSDDPGGAHPWAVREYDSRDHKQRVMRCWELGRLQGERFGWVDGHGAFTLHAPGRYELPTTCYTAKHLDSYGTGVSRITTITYAPGRSPQPGRTVTWGPVDDDAVALTPAGEPRIAIGAEHVVLQVRPGEAPPLRRGVVERRDGTRTRFNYASEPPRRGRERPVAGTQSVAVRSPDPAGGEPWGIVIQRGTRGGVCVTGPDRLIGTQPGWVDSRLDTFASTAGFPPACGLRVPTRSYPMRLTTMLSSIPQGDDRGKIERRTLDNRLVFSGRVHSTVERVTIRTPRDVRTLIPSNGFVLAVYDGQFTGGKATATAHLRDGREVTRSLYVG